VELVELRVKQFKYGLRETVIISISISISISINIISDSLDPYYYRTFITLPKSYTVTASVYGFRKCILVPQVYTITASLYYYRKCVQLRKYILLPQGLFCYSNVTTCISIQWYSI